MTQFAVSISLKTAGVADGNGNWAFQLINYYYLKDGKVEHQDYGNGVRHDLQYDGRGFTRYTHSYKTGSYQSYADRTYYRDNRDRIWAFQKGWDAAANPKENGRGDRFAYDGEGQLTQAYYECADPTGSFNSWRDGDVYTYDALGNRSGGSWVSSLGSVNWSRRDNGLNQYSSWTPSVIYYDDNYYGAPGNGVLMQEGTITASYNALNQPIAVWSPAYGASNFMWFGYDPLGRCVKRWVSPASNMVWNATYMYYDGSSIIQEGDNIWSPTRLYVQGNRMDELEVTFNVVTSQYGFHQYDARGHCILTTDISGNMMEEYDYDAWGKPHFYSGSSWWSWDLGYSEFGNRFLFTGREWLSDLGVYDYRNRLYHPELGRFLQPDPKEFAAGDYNLYRYCHNDPVNKSDPMGLAPTLEEMRAVDILTSIKLMFGVQAPQNEAEADLSSVGRMMVMGLPGSGAGPGKAIQFAQRGISPIFRGGEFAGKPISEVVSGLTSGTIKASQLPIQTVTRNGIIYTLNNRSLMALRQAGASPTVVKDMTGNPAAEKLLTQRLSELGGKPPLDYIPKIRGQ